MIKKRKGILKIAIDSPAAAGAGTLAKTISRYYNLIYQYKNDCLAASIEYKKDYYSDRDIKPEENIFIKLTIIPFGDKSTTFGNISSNFFSYLVAVP